MISEESWQAAWAALPDKAELIVDARNWDKGGSLIALAHLQAQFYGNKHEKAAAKAYLDSFPHRGNPLLEEVA